MNRLALLLLLAASPFCHLVVAADRTLTAEGDYVSQRFAKRPAHWKLWHLRNGDYEVEETLFLRDVVQVFRFDPQFLPKAFSLTIDTDKALPKAVRQNAAFTSRSMISCRYGAHDLTCKTEKNGKTSTNSIPIQQPYVFIPGDFYALDQLWLMTGVLRLSEHNHSEDNRVNVYIMLDDKLRAGRAIQLTNAGKQTALVMGKTQPVTEYEVWTQDKPPGSWILSEPSVLQVTSHGLVASVHAKTDSGLGFAIINYKQYEPWMLSE